MKKCAIAIGVNKAGNLPLLNAAAKGAQDFADWAQSQGYDTTLLTDNDGQHVMASDIKKAVNKYVNEKTYSQLIVFFSGHGILKGPNDEYWLLSEVDNDANEAVIVTTSKHLAYNAGIPHITFISDACRSVANNMLLAQVNGSVIFPNVAPTQQLPDIDMFYATRPGSPAWEVRDGEEAIKNYKGIFTDCLLQGLTGQVKEIIKELEVGANKMAAVFPYELKKYLETQVPLAAEAIKITLQQYPMIEVTSRPPTYLSLIGPAPRPTRGGSHAMETAKSVSFTHHFDDADFNINEVLQAHTNNNGEDDIAAEIKKIAAAAGRVSFETQTGFSIIGTHHFEAYINSGHLEVFEEAGYSHIRVYPTSQTASLLWVGQDGTGTPLAVLPGFIGHVLIEENRVVNINYVPSRNNNRYDDYMIRSDEVAQRRAAAALAARHGTFRISGDIYGIMDAASYLRNDKALDPSLGLYAAYAYAQAGKNSDVVSVFDYMKEEPEPVLFDVKLLATLHDNDAANQQVPHAPFCPMLTQGWSYLAINEAPFTQQLKPLMQHLIPGLWTTFTPEGVALVKQHLKTSI